MQKLILNAALSLQRSKRYRHAKEKARDLFENDHNPYKRFLDLFIIFLIVSSVFILVYEVDHPIPSWLDSYDIYFVSFVFFVEYIIRLWIHSEWSGELVDEYQNACFLHKKFDFWSAFWRATRNKLKYLITPAAIIDLLAILPAYRPLRVLRIFVLFRVLKLLRYTKSINQFVDVVVSKRFELLTLLFLLAFIVITAGIALYVLEERINPQINSLFDAIYWALITISTVGYGDIAPVTDIGRMISMFIIISGIAIISFATSVIVSAFSERLSELKENRIIEQVNKSRAFLIICGYGQMTKMLLRQQQDEIGDYVIMDMDKERVAQARKDGYVAIKDDASRFETLSRFNTDYTDVTVLCLTGNDIENIYITLNAKSISRRIKVIARVNNVELANKFNYAGADHLLMPNEVVNTMIRTAITQPATYKAAHAILTGKTIAKIDEMYMYEQHGLIGKRIGDIDFNTGKLILIGIERNGEFLFNPHQDEIVMKHDVLLVMGKQISIDYFQEQYRAGNRS